MDRRHKEVLRCDRHRVWERTNDFAITRIDSEELIVLVPKGNALAETLAARIAKKLDKGGL